MKLDPEMEFDLNKIKARQEKFLSCNFLPGTLLYYRFRWRLGEPLTKEPLVFIDWVYDANGNIETLTNSPEWRLPYSYRKFKGLHKDKVKIFRTDAIVGIYGQENDETI